MEGLKLCKKCGDEKEYKEFSKNRRRKDGHQSECKACIKIRDHNHYEKSKPKFAAWSKSRRLRVRKQVFEYLISHPCVDCGEVDVIVLEFDHRNPKTKRFDVMSATHGHSWKTILKEIKKCDVVCANCHKRRTAITRNWKTRLDVSKMQQEQLQAEKSN